MLRAPGGRFLRGGRLRKHGPAPPATSSHAPTGTSQSEPLTKTAASRRAGKARDTRSRAIPHAPSRSRAHAHGTCSITAWHLRPPCRCRLLPCHGRPAGRAKTGRARNSRGMRRGLAALRAHAQSRSRLGRAGPAGRRGSLAGLPGSLSLAALPAAPAALSLSLAASALSSATSALSHGILLRLIGCPVGRASGTRSSCFAQMSNKALNGHVKRRGVCCQKRIALRRNFKTQRRDRLPTPPCQADRANCSFRRRQGEGRPVYETEFHYPNRRPGRAVFRRRRAAGKDRCNRVAPRPAGWGRKNERGRRTCR